MMGKYPYSFGERVRLLLSMHINGARIAVLLIPLVMLVFFPKACYTYLDAILGGIIVAEVGLTLIDRLVKSKIWREVIGILLLYSFMITGIHMLYASVEKVVQNTTPMFSIPFWIKLLGIALFQVIVSAVYVKTDRRVKKLSIPNIEKVGYFLFPSIIGIGLGTFLAEWMGCVSFEVEITPEYLWSILFFACVCLIMYYYCMADYHHESLLIKYKDDTALKSIMKTHRDGSVYVHYPINDQSIGDCIDYGLLYLRSPHTVRSHNAEGAWYTIREEHYEKWLELTPATPSAKATVKRKKRSKRPL